MPRVEQSEVQEGLHVVRTAPNRLTVFVVGDIYPSLEDVGGTMEGFCNSCERASVCEFKQGGGSSRSLGIYYAISSENLEGCPLPGSIIPLKRTRRR